MIGSETGLKSALEQAGWTIVDRTDRQAFLDGLRDTMSKEAYVAMPMSNLMLFGRIQDYGYAQGDPLRVVKTRHHFRIWKAPFVIGGVAVWAGAGTHDIGFDRDNRNHGVTHKIDPDTDKERDYIAASFAESGSIVKAEYMTPTNPVKSARTASGRAFNSDGRTAILYTRPEPRPAPSSPK